MAFADASELICSRTACELNDGAIGMYKTYIHYKDQYIAYVSRLTVVSREAKKKQHACASSGPRDHYSEIFTRMAALNF